MVASVGPVLEVVVDGGGSVGQPPLVLAYLPLDCAGSDASSAMILALVRGDLSVVVFICDSIL